MSETAHLVYLHGFNSSPGSFKARLLAKTLAERDVPAQFHCPALPPEPAAAAAVIDAMLAPLGAAVTLIGSSLGGYYATAFAERRQLRAVLVNPAITPQEALRPYLGRQRNLYTGAEYDFTETHLEQLAALWVEHITPERYFLLHETGDELLDYRIAMQRYLGARMHIVEGGDHAFQSFGECIPLLLEFAAIRAPT